MNNIFYNIFQLIDNLNKIDQGKLNISKYSNKLNYNLYFK